MKIITEFFLKYAMVLAGLAITAFGVVAFILSNDIMIGSTTGLGRIGEHFFGVPVSVAVAMVNGALFILALVVLGKKFAASIVVGTVAYPAFMGIFESMENIGNLTHDPIIATVYGGVICGIGMGLIIKSGASTGGTDVIAIILNKKFGWPLSVPMYAVDGLILISQVIFAKSAEVILLGIIVTFLYSMIAEKVVLMGGGALQLIIISRKHEEIRQQLADMIVGNTILHGQSGYHGEETDVILCITNGRELHGVQMAILDIDPEAFITISAVKEVKGRGYSFDHGLAKKIRKEQKAEK